ncbi:hypothetical protein Tco_1179895 [Tanacetum coccineum]
MKSGFLDSRGRNNNHKKKKNDNVLGDASVEPGAKVNNGVTGIYIIGTISLNKRGFELNTGLILFVNVVNVVPTSTNKNGSEQVGDESVMKEITTSYANKLSPMSLTKANLWKLDAIMPNDVNYDVWLPLASVHGLLKEDLSRVPLWMKFHDVSLVSYTLNGLSLIATKIGTPMMIAFGRHLEEIHTLQTQFGKKGDKIAIL